MLISGKTEQDVFNKGNYFLEYLRQWALKNCLKINTNKTKGILFRPKNRIHHCNFDLVLGNSKIEIVPAIKSLGVVFTESLSWDAHVDSVRLRINRINGIVNRHRHVLPQQAKILIYNAYILPIISYCFTIWGKMTKQNEQKILVAQKRAIRLIANVPWYTHTNSYFTAFHILKVTELYPYKLLIMYKTAVLGNNDRLLCLFKLNSPIPAYNTRNSVQWCQPFCRTTYRQQSPSYVLPRYLNILHANNIFVEQISKGTLINHLYMFENV